MKSLASGCAHFIGHTEDSPSCWCTHQIATAYGAGLSQSHILRPQFRASKITEVTQLFVSSPLHARVCNSRKLKLEAELGRESRDSDTGYRPPK